MKIIILEKYFLYVVSIIVIIFIFRTTCINSTIDNLTMNSLLNQHKGKFFPKIYCLDNNI